MGPKSDVWQRGIHQMSHGKGRKCLYCCKLFSQNTSTGVLQSHVRQHELHPQDSISFLADDTILDKDKILLSAPFFTGEPFEYLRPNGSTVLMCTVLKDPNAIDVVERPKKKRKSKDMNGKDNNPSTLDTSEDVHSKAVVQALEWNLAMTTESDLNQGAVDELKFLVLGELNNLKEKMEALIKDQFARTNAKLETVISILEGFQKNSRS
jgi:hypothetical protein